MLTSLLRIALVFKKVTTSAEITRVFLNIQSSRKLSQDSSDCYVLNQITIKEDTETDEDFLAEQNTIKLSGKGKGHKIQNLGKSYRRFKIKLKTNFTREC